MLLVILSRTNWEDQAKRAKELTSTIEFEYEDEEKFIIIDEESPQSSIDNSYCHKIDGSSNV